MKHSKKSRKILILGFAAVLMVLLILGAIFVLEAKSTLYNEKNNYLEEISYKSAENIHEEITGNLSTIDAIASILGGHEDFSVEHSLPLLKEEANKDLFIRMGIILPNGEAYTTDGLHFDLSQRDYFKKAMINENVVSDTLNDVVNGNKINVFSAPIHHDNQIAGVIFATKSHEAFSKSLSIESFHGEGYSYIIKSNGEPVIQTSHKNSIENYNNFFTDISKTGTRTEDLQRMKNNIANNKNGSFQYNKNHTDYQVCYTKIGINDWYVVSLVPSQVISAQSDKLISKLIFLTIAIIFFTALLGFFMIRSYENNNKKLEKLAYTDEITGCSNRAKFYVDAQKLLKDNTDVDYALVLLDIRKFKVINDMFGHETGNDILKRICKILCQNTDDAEAFARISSDNFDILMKHPSDYEVICRLEKILSNLENMIDDYKIEIAVGIYPILDHNADINIIHDRAGVAKNIAKRQNDTFYHFFREENRQEIIDEKEIENIMESALEHNEFEVYLQPKYLLANNKVVGAEALVRWNRGEAGIIQPNDFIPIFEKNGFIRKLDLYMFEKVCELMEKWKIQHPNVEIPPISVNISRVHLSDQNLPTKLWAIANKYKIDHNLLEIELTESAVFLGLDNMIEIMHNIKKAGFLLSIDDFGSGYSSLGALKDLPTDFVKLDKSFLDDSVNNQRSESIIRNIISMTKGLGIATVAEGVEDAAQANLLRSAGCDIVQGFYFSKPITIEEFEKIIF